MSGSKRPRTLHDTLSPIEERLGEKRRTRAMKNLAQEMRLQRRQQETRHQEIDATTRRLQEECDKYIEDFGRPPSQRKLADITGINRKAIAKRKHLLNL